MLMAWCIGVYAFLPSFAKANVVFNYVTWFSVLYVIASYIRLYPKKWFSNVTVTGLIAGVSLLLSWVSIIVLAMFSRMVGKGIGLCYFFVADIRQSISPKIAETGASATLTVGTQIRLVIFWTGRNISVIPCWANPSVRTSRQSNAEPQRRKN